ncbi:hypothetical protein HDV06_001179 [Boothiomyces sp. JEL0866]|nr:hypothetical protein HDV06_001179 [Boothiomyces sp. JEL0866]
MPTQTNQVLCYFQGIEGTFASNMDVTTNAVVGIWSFYIFYIGGKNKTVIVNQVLMVACIYTFSFVMSIIPLFSDKPDLYSGVIWCWINTIYPGYQFYTLFLWMWIVIPFNIISLGFTWYHIQKRHLGSRIITRLFTYLIAFLMVWLPTICYRASLRLFNTAPFGLTVLEYIMIPLRGFLHYICLVISLNVQYENVDEQPIPQGLSLVSGSRSHGNVLSALSIGSRVIPESFSSLPSEKDSHLEPVQSSKDELC